MLESYAPIQEYSGTVTAEINLRDANISQSIYGVGGLTQSGCKCRPDTGQPCIMTHYDITRENEDCRSCKIKSGGVGGPDEMILLHNILSGYYVDKPEHEGKVCPCGTVFFKDTRTSIAQWNDRKFCSKQCANKYQVRG